MGTFEVSNFRQPVRASKARSEGRLAAARHIKGLTDLNENEFEYLLQGAGEAAFAATGSELVRAGAPLNQPRVMLTGWAGLSVVMPDGRRQLLDFALPGDLIGFSPRANARAKASVVCLTPVETVKLPALATCHERSGHFPGLLRVLHRAQDELEDHLLNQIVRNGCQAAHEKLCSLLLELYSRLARVGQVSEGSFDLPVSQLVIADALGLSAVHLNRTLQHLKREHIVQSEGHCLTILNLPVLRKLAGQVRLSNAPDDGDLAECRTTA